MKARAIVDGSKGKHEIDLSAFTVSEQRSFGSGQLKSMVSPDNIFDFLEIEKDIKLEIQGPNGNWREIWDGFVFNPEIDLTRGTVSTLGRGHTAFLLNTFIDSNYYFDEMGYVAKALMTDNGMKGNDIINNPQYKLRDGDVSNWTEETDGSWSAANSVYTGNDGALDRTVYDTWVSSDFLMRAKIDVTAATTGYGFIFRYVDANNYYRFDFKDKVLYGVYGGTEKTLAELAPAGTVDGSICRIWMRGNTGAIAIGDGNAPDYFWENGHSIGKLGLFVNNANVDFSDFEIFKATDSIRHFQPTRVTLMQAMQDLRLLSFNANDNGADWYLDRNKNLHWKYRDYNEPVVMTLTEGHNILSGKLFQDYDSVRNKVSVYGSSEAIKIPDLALSPDYFCKFTAQDGWVYDGSWSGFTMSSVHGVTGATGTLGIQMVEAAGEATTYANYPYSFASAGLGISTSDYDYCTFTTTRGNAQDLVNLSVRIYEDAGNSVTRTASGATDFPVTPDSTTLNFDISGIDTINYIGLQHGNTDAAASNITVLDINFYNSGADDLLVTKTDADTIYSETKEYEETNVAISSLDATKDYVESQLALKKTARWKGTLTVKGNMILRAGSNVKVVVPSAGLDQVMRVSAADHSFDGGKLTTKITVDEPQTLLAQEFAASRSALTETRNRDIATSLTTITL